MAVFISDLKFLVVDDMLTMRKMVSKSLASIGAKNIVEGKDGQDAWNAIENSAKEGNPIQFVVSDWNMPELSGLDLLKRIRSSRTHANLPFLFVTAESESFQVMDAIDLGADGYVVKPFSPKVLEEKIFQVFEKRFG